MKKTIFTILLSALSSYGVLTITFDAPFSGGVSGNFADNSGTTFNGLLWGIVVDVDGNGFESHANGACLNVGGTFDGSDDIFIAGDLLTGNLPGGTEGDFATTETQGTLLGGVTGIDDIHANSGFSIIWFDDAVTSLSAGNNTTVDVGVLNDPSFILPSVGGTESYDDVFLGADPVRAANDFSIKIGAIPEPTSSSLLGLGAIALLVRRKR